MPGLYLTTSFFLEASCSVLDLVSEEANRDGTAILVVTVRGNSLVVEGLNNFAIAILYVVM